MYILSRIIAGVVLSLQCYWDIRYKEIPTIVSIFAGVVGLVIHLTIENDLQNMLIAFVPGIVCLFCCMVTKESVGYGDAILLIAMGCLYSCEELVFICSVALVTAAVVSMVLCIGFHKKGNYEIPFVPFLWLGWLLELVTAQGRI